MHGAYGDERTPLDSYLDVGHEPLGALRDVCDDALAHDYGRGYDYDLDTGDDGALLSSRGAYAAGSYGAHAAADEYARLVYGSPSDLSYGDAGQGTYSGGLAQDATLMDAWRDYHAGVRAGYYDYDDDDETFALADLLSYARALELDSRLAQDERLGRWHERLAWDALQDDNERRAWFERLDMRQRARLGLADGYWATRYGGVPRDLSYLLQQPARPLTGEYARLMARHDFAPLMDRYRPLLRALPPRPRTRLPPCVAAPRLLAPHAAPSVPFASVALTRAPYNVRLHELAQRLRIAETRASLSSLAPAQRSLALDHAREIRRQMNELARVERDIDVANALADERTARDMAHEDELRARALELQLDRLNNTHGALFFPPF